jgi:myo-inositol-1(or 4)-monophosphatase
VLVREAGGKFCDFQGKDGIPTNGNLIAGNLPVATAMAKIIGANSNPQINA